MIGAYLLIVFTLNAFWPASSHPAQMATFRRRCAVLRRGRSSRLRAKELVVQFYGSVCFFRRTAISLSPFYAVSSLQQLKLSDPPPPVFKHPINLNAPFHISNLDFEQPFKGVCVDPVVQEAQAGLADTFGLNVNSAFLALVILVLINGTLGLFIAFGAIGE